MTTIIRAVVFDDDDRDLVKRALGPYKNALGEDEKERLRVGRHVNRIVENAGNAAARLDGESNGEPYFADDITDLLAVAGELRGLFEPQASADWWRGQGAPGGDDAIQGLADERLLAVDRLEALMARCVEWLAQVHGVLDTVGV